MANYMSKNVLTLIGILLITILVALIVILGKFDFYIYALLIIPYGLLGVYLYSYQSKNWQSFLFLKVPLNILFNPFLFVLLLKSWTMLGFRDELEELDKKIRDGELNNSDTTM